LICLAAVLAITVFYCAHTSRYVIVDNIGFHGLNSLLQSYVCLKSKLYTFEKKEIQQPTFSKGIYLYIYITLSYQ
jgi:hypothetical protein